MDNTDIRIIREICITINMLTCLKDSLNENKCCVSTIEEIDDIIRILKDFLYGIPHYID